MLHIVCPKCRNPGMTQEATDPRIFTCSKCGEFVLLPAEPKSGDISSLWDYLIQSGKHIKQLESMLKNRNKPQSS